MRSSGAPGRDLSARRCFSPSASFRSSGWRCPRSSRSASSTPCRRPGCPKAPTLANYPKVLFESNIPRYFLNSAVISVGVDRDRARRSRSSPPTASPASVSAASRLQAFILVGQLLPTAAIIVPLYIMLGCSAW